MRSNESTVARAKNDSRELATMELPIPPALLRRAASRLSTAAILVVLSFLVAFPIMNWAPPTTGEMTIANAVAGLVIAVSLAVAVIARLRVVSAPHVLNLALIYEVVGGLGIAIAETFATYDPYSVVRGVSWVCLWIVLFPLVVPTTRGKMLLAALATATMGPLALIIAIRSGVPQPSVQTFTYLVLPNYLAAGLAMILHRILHRLRVDVSKAEQMGAYRMVELLGRGGMGEVWRATHRTLARPAAIKLISPEVLAGRSGADVVALKARFKREARITSQLTSLHTIQIYDFGITDNGILYYVMELLHGVDLETLVAEHGPLHPGRAVDLLLQVCDSLAEAHQVGLVHRDIKPANLYVCRLGEQVDQIKVLDFGLVTAQDSDTRITHDNQITGTPAYLAPEVIKGDREPDERVDVYALGCVAYWLLTAQLVFVRATAFKMLYAHVEEEPAAPSKRRDRGSPGTIPEELDALVLRCLSKNPDERPRDAGELADALRGLEVAAWSKRDAQRWWREHRVVEPRRLDPGAEVVRTAIPRKSLDAS
ncbi:MAG: serine/threonine-protein kinase [Myxococcota bacterium]